MESRAAVTRAFGVGIRDSMPGISFFFSFFFCRARIFDPPSSYSAILENFESVADIDGNEFASFRMQLYLFSISLNPLKVLNVESR